MGKEVSFRWWHSNLVPQQQSWSRLAQVVTVVLGTVLLLCLLLPTVPSDQQQRSSLLGPPASAQPRFRLSPKEPPTALAAPGSDTRQEDVFISVKTSGQFHESRLDVVLQTWFTLAREQTWFFTDQADERISRRTNGHLRVTGCSSSHNRQALCCKMAAEFDAFLDSGKRWFCHFDDDNYVNVPRLVRKLQEYDHNEDWYLGKPSIPEPLEILDRDSDKSEKLRFWFATGGAGFCLSQSLALKMLPVAGGGKFESVGNKIRLPDDVTVGYLSEVVFHVPLTVVREFHSHLEPQRMLERETLSEQISFSYSEYGQGMNVVPVDDTFSEDEDPTRFKSIHCKLFPNFSWCPR